MLEFIFFWIFDFVFFLSFTSFLIAAFIGTSSKRYTRAEACFYYSIALSISICGLGVTSAIILKVF